MTLALYFSIIKNVFFNDFFSKLFLRVWSTWSRFQFNPLSMDDLAVLCSKGAPAKKLPFFNEVTEAAVFRDGEEHASAAANQSCLYRTFNATQTESRGDPYEEAGRQKTCSSGPDRGTLRSLRLQLEDDSTDQSCLQGPDFLGQELSTTISAVRAAAGGAPMLSTRCDRKCWPSRQSSSERFGNWLREQIYRNRPFFEHEGNGHEKDGQVDQALSHTRAKAC